MNSKIVLVVVGLAVVVFIGGFFLMQEETKQPQTNQTTQNATTSSATSTKDETEDNDITMVQIALIALEDNGESGKKIGCNDSVVLIDQQVPGTTAPLRAALMELLSIKDSSYGESGLYTAFADADLSVEDVRIENGEAIIALEGSLSLGGVCDAPRVQAQLVETALQFPTVDEVTITLDGEPLEEALSEM